MTPEQEFTVVNKIIANRLAEIAQEEAFHQRECQYGNDCDFMNHCDALHLLACERKAIRNVRDKLFTPQAADKVA
jgi:hypothetical protein